jgi:hypothetical protein
VPFWFGWSTVLFAKNVLQHRNWDYNIYISGIGFGSFMGNLVFISGGRFVVEVLNTNQDVMHWIIGCVFLVTSGILLWKKLKAEKEGRKATSAP